MDQEGPRCNVAILFFISIIVNIGMWLERYVIIVTSLHRDFLPSSWGMYQGSRYDWSFYLGTMGLFLTLFYLFIRVLPMIAIFEMRMLLPGRTRTRKRSSRGRGDIERSGCRRSRTRATMADTRLSTA